MGLLSRLERQPFKLCVPGSSPGGLTNFQFIFYLISDDPISHNSTRFSEMNSVAAGYYMNLEHLGEKSELIKQI